MSGIFISYRRSASKHLARLIFNELRTRGYDVFLDVTTIDSGEFDRIILNQIAARPHFLLILSPGSLERCVNEGDWLRREIEEAFRLKRNIVPIFDEGFNIELETQYLPESVRSALPRLNAPPFSHYYFDAFIDTICNRFLKQPTYEVAVAPTPTEERTEVERRIEQATRTSITVPKQLSSLDLMPSPFAWIPITAGQVMLTEGGYVPRGGQTYQVEAFEIGKYPITNAQFAKFIEAGGYDNTAFWTDEGWQTKEDDSWTAPRFWKNKKWNGSTQPVVGVSWYEAVAFCTWISAVTNENISLPTEQQWQRAVRGDTTTIYPWGNSWDPKLCNNSVANLWENETTSIVTEYQDKGDSLFGVVDMIGNVWEWCLTTSNTGRDTITGTSARILRGGSWADRDREYFRSDFRPRRGPPNDFDERRGFRIVRLKNA
jgi:formylglycine-generating enzyme required for sulfatase activity